MVLGAHEQNEIVPDRIVRVEEVRDYTQETKTSRKKDELVFFAQFVENVLLEIL